MNDQITKPDVISFRLIDGQLPPGESNHIGVVGIFVNDRELLDIVREIETEHIPTGPSEYIYQTAKELYGIDNLTDMIGDETVAEDPETLLAFLEEKGHPALTMEPMM